MSHLDEFSAAAMEIHHEFTSEVVTVIPLGELPIAARATFEFEPALRDVNGFRPTILEGRLTFLVADRSTLIPDERTPLMVNVRGDDWYVTDVSHDIGGVFQMFIRNELADQSHAIDLQGNQHPYGQ